MNLPRAGVQSEKTRILVADDEATFRDATVALLQQEGYEAEGAANGQEAAARLGGARFHLLIADIKMPGNHQLELIESLAQLPYRLPVILLTGYPALDTAVQAVSLPVVAYLTKPIAFRELLPHVRAAVQRATSMNSMMALREQLEAWRRDLLSIERGLEVDVNPDASEYMVAFLHLTLMNINHSMREIRLAAEAFVAADPQLEKRVELNRSVEEAIEVLERTKKMFKSKELADLRIRLEDVLRRS